MTKDRTVILKGRPGTMVDVGEPLGKAGKNIDEKCGFPCKGKGVFHILVEDGLGALSALEAAGQTVQGMRDVLVVEVEDRPGELGRICHQIADVGVNVNLTYVASQSRLVFGADDLEGVRAALG